MELTTAQAQRALFLAAVCQQTYAQFSNQDGSFVLPYGYSLFELIEAESLLGVWERFGFILQADDEIIIAFRGSSSAPNWVADVIATQRKPKWSKSPCLTHRGFTNIYDSARKHILSALKRLPEHKKLFVTGHSLGAALATLCAFDIALNTNRTPILFTFASPRVGDPDFMQLFAKQVPNSYRISNAFDAVTHAPPNVFKLPKQDKSYYYSHVPVDYPLHFANLSLSDNHSLGNYFAELTKLDPSFVQRLEQANPGFCPVFERVL